MHKLIAIPIAVFSLFLVSCEDPNLNAVNLAQICMNESANLTGSNLTDKAESCYGMLNGIDSPQASLVRCGALYAMRGFGTSEFLNVFQQLEGAGNQTFEMMAALSFGGANPETGADRTTDANTLVTECSNSGSPGMEFLAMQTRAGTALNIGDANPVTAAALQGNIGSQSSADNEAIGQMVIDLSGDYCSGSSGDNAVCTEIQEAINQNPGNAAAVGACFLECASDSGCGASC